MTTGVLVTIGLFGLVHAGTTIWFLSQVNTTLGFVLQKMDAIEKTLVLVQGSHITKEEAAIKFADHEKQLGALWKRVDDLRTDVTRIQVKTEGQR